MNDTPRINAKRSGKNNYFGDWVDADFAAQIERELNAANERIKRLEEAGDNLESRKIPTILDRKAWRKAKENKP